MRNKSDTRRGQILDHLNIAIEYHGKGPVKLCFECERFSGSTENLARSVRLGANLPCASAARMNCPCISDSLVRLHRVADIVSIGHAI